MPKRWYVLQTMSSLSAVAEANLRNQNFKTYQPMLEGKFPFKGYIFIELDLDTFGWQRINNTKGVLGWLPRNNERPIALPVGFVEGIGDLIYKNKFNADNPEEFVNRYLPADMVRVSAGPLEGYVGEVVSVSKNSLEILICFLNKKFSVKSPIESVVRA